LAKKMFLVQLQPSSRRLGDGQRHPGVIYVEDLAEAIAVTAERCAESEPINLGTREEIRIRDLARNCRAHGLKKGKSSGT
jgi:nucleoside-diphosphate-sugar epimerase